MYFQIHIEKYYVFPLVLWDKVRYHVCFFFSGGLLDRLRFALYNLYT